VTTPLDHGKRAIRDHIGLWVLYEARNRIVFARRVPAVARFEDAEVLRLRGASAHRLRTTFATVIPTYRRGALLAKAVESALGQTVIDQTVIVVDDGGGISATLPDDPRLVVVSLARNTAVLGLVRNVGIRLTNSKYVAFLDDDNEWRPDHLEVALDGLRCGADLVYTAVERHRADGTVHDVLSTPFDRRRLADDCYVDANSLVVVRDPDLHFSRIPRTRSTLPKEDWEFVHRLSRTHRTRHLPVPTVRYLVNAESYYTAWAGPGIVAQRTPEDRRPREDQRTTEGDQALGTSTRGVPEPSAEATQTSVAAPSAGRP
jgi:hypothetical protein